MSIKIKFHKFIPYLVIIALIVPIFTRAVPEDTDGDGVSDKDETEIYKTDPLKADSDNDGFKDWVELNHGYSPLNPKPIKLEENDQDQDGLSDRLELKFHTDLNNPDTDGDGFKDGVEIKNGFDPLNKEPEKLPKRIEVNTKAQKLDYFLGEVKMGTFPVSTGVPRMPTPKGHFKIDGKNLKAWSSYGLWMPFWMSLYHGKFGIHELPEWPNGYKEGENHLGKPASHGCIRLGIGPAKLLYEWAEIGTPVFIY